MGLLAGGPLKGNEPKPSSKPERTNGDEVSVPDGTSSLKRSAANLRQRLTLLLERFDVDDKEELAAELAEVLELSSGESLLAISKRIIGEDLTQKQEFQLGVLDRIVKDRNLDALDEDFPDDYGAPKSGL